MNRLFGHIKWLFRSRRTRRLDEKALAIADRYGMRKEYLEARKFGLEPLEALEDWDLILPEERALFLEPHCGLDLKNIIRCVFAFHHCQTISSHNMLNN